MAQETIIDGHYRELLALVKGLDTRLSETREDARDAKVAVIRLAERNDAQNIPAQIAELHGEMEKFTVAARTDLINSANKITKELRDGQDQQNARIKALEDFKTKVDGATGLVGWLAKNAPWLLTLAFAIAAAVGFRDKLPT